MADRPQEAPPGSASRPLLTLAMIVRDGGQNLAPLLAGAGPWVDEIVIGDTGSRDGSTAVAMDAGARVLPLTWREDFARARNEVLDQCRGQWVLCLDADEQICAADWRGIREWAGALTASDCKQAGVFVTRNYLTDRYSRRGWTAVPANDPHALASGPAAAGYVATTKVRLFPNLPDVRFHGRIHETVEASLWEAGIPIVDVPWPVHHFGYLTRSEEKGRRYLHLAHLKTTEQPHNAQAWSELADCAVAAGDLSQALFAIDRSLVLDPSDPGRRLTAGWLLLETGDLVRADAQLAAVAGYPDVDDTIRAETAHLRAQVALREDRPEAAAALLAKALHYQPDNGNFLNTLGSLNLALGRAEAALRALLRARDLLPGQAAPCRNLALLYTAAGHHELAAAALAEADRRAGTGTPHPATSHENAPEPVCG